MTQDHHHLHGITHTPFPDNLHPQLETTCRELNERIARLALVLHLQLDDPEDMAKVMAHRPAQTAPGGVVLGMLEFGQESQRRQEQLWTELRGLLVLREDLEKVCLDLVGYVTTSDILVDVEQRMAERGFKLGADGMDLQRLIDSLTPVPPGA